MALSNTIPVESNEDKMTKLLDVEAGKLQPRFEALFRTYSTKKLLSLRHYSHPDWLYSRDGWSQDDIEQKAKQYALKKVLAERPHVLSKPEGKKRRQQQARASRGNGKQQNR